MANPIGISFIPTEDNQAQGAQRGALEGAGGNLGQAFKVLSLELPRVLGAQSLAPKRLLTSPGSSGIPGAFNPHAAVFEALLNAMSGGGAGSLASLFGGASNPSFTPGGAGNQTFTPPDYATRVTPGSQNGDRGVVTDTPPAAPSYSQPSSGRLEDIYAGNRFSQRQQY